MRNILRQKLLWIAAFGYFVDLFDLVLYGVVRVDSLKSLGYTGQDIFSVGANLLNIQMAGMMVGGLIWGLIGDRKGRRDALFGSIFLYSLANFLNAFVHSFEGYAALRFLAGVGLAGELGAAITLVSESIPQNVRGLGSAFIATIGFMGAVFSSWVCQKISWQHAYLLGGILGLLLLMARFGIRESSVFQNAKRGTNPNQWGSLKLFFASKIRLKYFLLALMAGVPIWYVAGILSYFAPEFANALQIQGEVTAGTTIMMGYLGSIIGDIACGLLSQFLKSRKKAVVGFILLGGLLAVFHPWFLHGASANTFYWVRFMIGFGNGFFAILIAWIAEIFGTNLRATLTTLLANLIRAAVIPITFFFKVLQPSLGLMNTSMTIGFVCFAGAIWCGLQLPETFSRNIDFLES